MDSQLLKTREAPQRRRNRARQLVGLEISAGQAGRRRGIQLRAGDAGAARQQHKRTPGMPQQTPRQLLAARSRALSEALARLAVQLRRCATGHER